VLFVAESAAPRNFIDSAISFLKGASGRVYANGFH
jgi:hypothetical protein